MATIDVLELFSQAALEVHGKKFDGISPDTVIAKLGLDSVARLELVGCFEEKLSVRLPDEDLAQVRTVGDLCALVKRHAPPGTDVRY